MTDSKFDEKYKELQKYLPFLQKVIEKLKINNDQKEDNSRKGQLQKMEKLFDLLTSKGRNRLKLETLLKCEGVLIKLHAKIEKSPFLQNDNEASSNIGSSNANKQTAKKVPNPIVEVVDITGPASPPPQLVEDDMQPVEIPTERRCSPIVATAHENYKEHHNMGRDDRNRDRYHDHRHERRSSPQRHYEHNQRESKNHRHDRERSYGPGSNTLVRSQNNDRNNTKSRGEMEFKSFEQTHSSRWGDSSFNSNSANTSVHRNHASEHYRNPEDSVNNRETKSTLNNTNQNEIYSPEESWNEIVTTSKTPIIDLRTSPSPSRESVDKTYHDTIFKFKKQDNLTRTSKVFERLGEKVGNETMTKTAEETNTKYFENFKINVPNESTINKHSLSSNKHSPTKSAPISVPVKVPTIPEVLKSPPLSANDISNLLNEFTDVNSNSSANISEIGTRRPPKVTEAAKATNATNDTSASTLDMVRKKFAMITKNSPQFRESPESPMHSTNFSSSSPTTNVPQHGISNERLALKYHPHPRAEPMNATINKSKDSSLQNGCNPFKPNDPRLNLTNRNIGQIPLSNVNVLPSINLSDPRLRKSAASATAVNMSPVYGMPQVSLPLKHHLTSPNSPFQIMRIDPSQPVYPVMRNDNQFMHTGTSHPMRPSPELQRTHQQYHNVCNNSFYNSRRPPYNTINKSFTPKTVTATITKSNPKNGNSNTSGEDWNMGEAPPTSQTMATTCINIPLVSQKANNFNNNKTTAQPASEEENWDSEPETTVPSKTFNANTEKDSNTVTPTNGQQKLTSITTASTVTANPYSIPSLAQQPRKVPTANPPLNSRFSALLNDKSERIKYFESKKQKHVTPQTYPEFKKAKARAAAEEAARKATLEAKNKTTEGTTEQRFNSNKIAEILAKDSLSSKPMSESTLDKLYRSSNFSNADFPKTKISFKIPKKSTASPSLDEKEAEKEVEKLTEKRGEKAVEEVVENKILKTEEKEKTFEPDSKKSQKKTEGNQGKSQEKKKPPKDTNKKKKEENMKDISSENGTKKSILPEKNNDVIIDKKIENNNNIKRKPLRSSLSEVIENTELKCNDQFTNKESKAINENFESKSNTADVHVEGSNEIVISSSEEENSKSQNSQEVHKKLGKDISNKIESPKLAAIDALKPARIIKRRCTMISYGSAPEVDKDKLLASNALLFEDVQERAKLKEKIANDEKVLMKKNKSLVDIFQKTDDNCTVSTQNIISGKRRTRPTVNFNEVQQVKSLFKYAKPAEPKKALSPQTKKVNRAAARNKTKSPVPKLRRNSINIAMRKGTTAAIKSVPVGDIEKEETPEKEETLNVKLNVATSESNNQNSTVSSTSSSDIVVSDSKKSVNVIDLKQSVNDDKPSSSGKGATVPIAVDEENGSQELLEGFVQDILKPNADTAYIYSLLKQILSEDQLQQVKSVLETASKMSGSNVNDIGIADDEHLNANAMETDDNQEQEDNYHKAWNIQINKTPPKTRLKKSPKQAKVTRKRTNELDRLNEDIRDMFICEGVLTATGRRMCTLVAAEATAKNGTKSSEGIKENEYIKNKPEKKNSPSTKKTQLKTKIGSRGLLTANVFKARQLRRSKRAKLNATNVGSASESEEESILDDSEMGTTDTNTDVVTSMTDDQTDSTLLETPPRPMPKLKPNTHIKLIEGKVTKCSRIAKPLKKLQVKLVKIKPCPKSKKPAAILKKLNDINNDGKIAVSSSGKSHNCDAAKTSVNVKHKKVEREAIQNTNFNWHSQSKYAKWCVLCNMKLGYAAVHYKMNHLENYASRMAPCTLQQFKQGKLSKPLFGVYQKKFPLWFYRCPFCLQHNRSSFKGWLDHFITHTGEYNYECSKCHKAGNKKNLMIKHIKKSACTGATVLSDGISQIVAANAKHIKGHVCHLCNYLQMDRRRLEVHYVQQHGCDEDKVDIMGYSINLMNIEDVKMVDSKTASEMESNALKELTNDSLVIDVDGDDGKVDIKNGKENYGIQKSKDDLNILEENEEQADLTASEKLKKNDVLPLDNSTRKSVSSEEADNNKASSSLSVHASTSNVFMPTREINSDSPTMDSFAQNFFTIEQEVRSSNAVAVDSDKSCISNVRNNISMAERLSQRFKDLKDNSISSLTAATTSKEESANMVKSNNVLSAELAAIFTEKVDTSTNITTLDSVIKSKTDTSTVDNMTEVYDDVAADNCNPEDDENWEDIEIVESAPSTTSSIVSTTSSIGKNIKLRNKNIYKKFSRLYASSNKFKKNSTSNLLSIKRKQQNSETTEADVGKAANCTEPSDAITEKIINNVDTAIAVANNFRTVTLTNLDDLLPNSPCNDPIELVPELASLEPLQDLNDISSILDSNFSPLDTHNLMADLEATNSVCINSDNQHTSIQEALDFVSEQQEQQERIDRMNTASNSEPQITQTSSQIAINRIQNIGYSLSNEDSTFKFYCLFQNCTFLYSSDAMGLGDHYLMEHPTTKWNGFCGICGRQIESSSSEEVNNFSLVTEEIKHMLENHTVLSDSQCVDTAVTPHEILTSVAVEEKPRIKIRRLTGDCLSSTSPSMIAGTSAFCLETSADPSSVFDENTNLSDLLNAKPRPPTKQMPPQINMPLTDPLLAPETSGLQMFKNLSNDITITSVSSSTEFEPNNSKTNAVASAFPLQISNVVSLNDKSNTGDKSRNIEGSTSLNDQSPSSTIQVPKISSVCSLTGGTDALWAKHIESERLELEKSAAESLEVSRILSNASMPTRTKRSIPVDSPEPLVVAETLPVGQATTGDFVLTQTISAQYCESGASSGQPQLGFNISIATTNNTATSSRSSSLNSSSPMTVVPASLNVGSVKTYTRPHFKCMGNGCKFQTRVPVAMTDHLHFHERRNFTTLRDYLQCSLCAHLSEDVNGYVKHAEEKHLTGKSKLTSNSEKSKVSELTKKIQNILKGEDSGSGDSSSSTMKESTSTAPIKTYREQLGETINEIVAPTGIPESKLYRCVIEGCKASLNESTFHNHIIYHLSTAGIATNYNYKCMHCNGVYHKPSGFKTHIKTHARHSYFCYLCMQTASNNEKLQKHFCEMHFTATLTAYPLIKRQSISDKLDIPGFYVSHAQKLTELEVHQYGEELIAFWQRKKAGSKTMFKPSEIALLPIHPIFQKEVYCAECMYKTKVRTNMLRHLQMHSAGGAMGGAQQVANVDPVNPVPCLNTNERHFDKMTNLASSSVVINSNGGGNTSNSNNTNNSGNTTKPSFKIKYDYIPETKRYTCGIFGCQYLTISDDILRSHLNALHNNIQSYSCSFCKEEICKRSISVERILNHLRFHGQLLYRCEECDYLHYMKTVVERHIHDKHATVSVNLITHDRSQSNSEKQIKELITSKVTPSGPDTASMHAKIETTNIKSKYKWACDLCGQKSITQHQIIAHCHTQHASKHQYQCTHCSFGAAQLTQILTHIDEKHDGKIREARYMFHKIVYQNDTLSAADTRPLWQRDDPKRVRHIRGILMEDEEESEQYRKRLCLENDYEDDDDNAGGEVGSKPIGTSKLSFNAATATSSTFSANPNLYLGLYQLGCNHCDFKSNFNTLKEVHWRNAHNTNIKSAKPFYFRLLNNLKCIECEKFSGTHKELHIHMQSTHNKLIYVAADPSVANELMCGYCNYTCERSEQLLRHHSRLLHKPHDLKRLVTDRVSAILKLGITETYLQCTICTELFTNRNAIDAHANEKHSSVEAFSFQTLSNTIIYCCPMCSFTSTNELNTLRHMIDHYERFQRCYFCNEPQKTFNVYMQHCYTDHREQIKRFSELYTLADIKKYLLQVLVLFPNGLIIDKKNLRQSKYGSEDSIQQLYEEICKTSQEPPIPRLSIARLVARKSIEARRQSISSPNPMDTESTACAASAMLLADRNGGNKTALLPKRICKRRMTVALGSEDTVANMFGHRSNDSTNFDVTKKTKYDILARQITLPPPLPVAVPPSLSISSPTSRQPNVSTQLEPYSFYGKTPEPIDLSKIYTKIAIAGVDTRLSIDKFKLLFKIDARVVVEKFDLNDAFQSKIKDGSNDYSHVKKACPASEKHKYV